MGTVISGEKILTPRYCVKHAEWDSLRHANMQTAVTGPWWAVVEGLFLPLLEDSEALSMVVVGVTFEVVDAICQVFVWEAELESLVCRVMNGCLPYAVCSRLVLYRLYFKLNLIFFTIQNYIHSKLYLKSLLANYHYSEKASVSIKQTEILQVRVK
jgi:hypothetical protein